MQGMEAELLASNEEVEKLTADNDSKVRTKFDVQMVCFLQ
jgi:hypothetical protein